MELILRNKETEHFEGPEVQLYVSLPNKRNMYEM